MLLYSEDQRSENVFHAFGKLPKSIKIFCINLLCGLNRISINRLKTPTIITFYVTAKCFAKCRHCFLGSRLNKNLDKELTLPEIKKVFTSLRTRLSRIAFGGGESFLREDIVEIYRLIYNINKPSKFWVATPGLYPEKIEKIVKEILLNIKNTPYVIAISLEGFEEVHDNIIGVKGAFKKALRTIDLLKKIVERHNNFSLRILTTISNVNYENLGKFIEFVDKELKLSQLFNFMWGANLTCFSIESNLLRSNFDPFDRTLIILPLETLQAINKLIDEKLQNKSLLSRIETLKRRYILDIIKSKRRVIPCMVVKNNATIYPDGGVSFCEFTNPIGNVHDFNFDLYKLWSSQKAHIMRSQLKDCACTLPYILGNSLSYSKKALLELL